MLHGGTPDIVVVTLQDKDIPDAKDQNLFQRPEDDVAERLGRNRLHQCGNSHPKQSGCFLFIRPLSKSEFPEEIPEPRSEVLYQD